MFGRKPKPTATNAQADAALIKDIMSSTNAMMAQFATNAQR